MIVAFKMKDKISSFLPIIKSVLNVVSMIGVKGLIIAGVVIGLFLLIQDLIYFLQGKDSLFGTLLENAGVDVDEVREKIWGFIDNIKQGAQDIWDAVQPVIQELKDFWDENSEQIMEIAQNGCMFLMNLIITIISVIGPFLTTIANLFKGLWALLNGDFEGFEEAMKGAWESFKEFALNLFDGLVVSIGSLFGVLPEDALKWAHDMLDSFIQGIKDKVEDVKNAVKGVGDKIKNFLGFSEPEEGPLSNFHTFSPDMMDSFINGIEQKRSSLKDMVAKVAGDIKGVLNGENLENIMGLAQNGVASESAVGNAMNTNNTSVVQNNVFNNTFNGGTSEEQRQTSKVMNSNAHDASAYLAHALAFGR